MRFLSFLASEKALIGIFSIFLISVPFGTKKFIYAFGSQADEFTSIFVYGTDIILLLFLAAFLAVNKQPIFLQKWQRISLLLFLFFSAVSIFLAAYKILAFYHFIRLLLLVIAAMAIGFLLRQGVIKLKLIAAVIAASSVFQALVAIFQFRFFRSSGLWFLGEPVVNVFTENIARFRIGDLTFLRSFGTMPHANILAAFLILGLLSFYYLWLRNNERYENMKKIFLAIGLFLVSLALLFTFSRSGWLVAGIVIFLVILWGLLSKDFRKQTFSLLIILITIFYLLFSNFSWLILPRAHLSAGEPSVSYRWLYNEIGWNVIKDKPLGVGIGNQLFYAIDNNLYQQFGIVHQRDWQPIHNVYLLIASEIGVLGLLAFLIFIAVIMFRKLKIGISTIMLVALLLFGLVDHFPWTLQSGRLMLWLTIGIVLGSNLVLVAQLDRARASGARDPSSSLGKGTENKTAL